MNNIENLKNLDNISSLIQEAKPLFFERKRKRLQTKMILSICLLIIPIIPINNYIQYENMLSQNDSILEYQGLPTDDYGLLMVY